VALVDAHGPVGQCRKTDAMFKKFLVSVLDNKPSEPATLADYLFAHGKLQEAKVLPMLHCPLNHSPPSTQPTLYSGPARFRFEAYTLNLVLDMLLTAKDGHVFHNYVSKYMKITNPDGSCCTNHRLYGDLPLEECVDLMYNLICEADADVIAIHDGPVRRILKNHLRLEKDRSSVGQNYEIVDVVTGGKLVSLLYHLQEYQRSSAFLANLDLPPAW